MTRHWNILNKSVSCRHRKETVLIFPLPFLLKPTEKDCKKIAYRHSISIKKETHIFLLMKASWVLEIHEAHAQSKQTFLRELHVLWNLLNIMQGLIEKYSKNPNSKQEMAAVKQPAPSMFYMTRTCRYSMDQVEVSGGLLCHGNCTRKTAPGSQPGAREVRENVSHRMLVYLRKPLGDGVLKNAQKVQRSAFGQLSLTFTSPLPWEPSNIERQGKPRNRK